MTYKMTKMEKRKDGEKKEEESEVMIKEIYDIKFMLWIISSIYIN